MSIQPLRIGIIGAGNNTRIKHIPLLQARESVTIEAVCNRSRESSARVAAEFGIPRVCSHWREIIEDNTIDAIVIGTWPSMHHSLVIAALEADKHVLCEARMAMNARQAREMAEAARQRPHLVAQLVPAPFTFPWDETVKRLIRESFFGELLVIRVSYATSAFVDEKAPITWRQETEQSGVNIMMMGVFYESLARWVGHARVVSAMGRTAVPMRFHPEEKRMKCVTVPDHIDILADMICGAQAHFQFSSLTGLAENHQEIRLYGRKGTLALDLAKGILRIGTADDPVLREQIVPPDQMAHWRVEEEFVNAIRGTERIRLTTFDEGVAYMEFSEAVSTSIIERRCITLPLS